MYQDILIGIDGSDVATTAASYGLAIASRFGATIHVVSVVEAKDRDTFDSAQQATRSESRRYVGKIESEAATLGCTVRTSVRVGRPSRELLTYVDDVDVDLLVLGTHGRTGIRRLVLGSVATAVIRDSSRPVLTASPSVRGEIRPFENILIATDGRSGVDAAVDQGLSLAEAFDATLHPVYVVDETRSHLDTIQTEFERVGEETTSKIASLSSERGITANRSVERGVPHEEISSYAEEHDIDLIVMGTESRSGIERFVIGSVSQRVIPDAPVPVLTVRGGSTGSG